MQRARNDEGGPLEREGIQRPKQRGATTAGEGGGGRQGEGATVSASTTPVSTTARRRTMPRPRAHGATMAAGRPGRRRYLNSPSLQPPTQPPAVRPSRPVAGPQRLGARGSAPRGGAPAHPQPTQPLQPAHSSCRSPCPAAAAHPRAHSPTAQPTHVRGRGGGGASTGRCAARRSEGVTPGRSQGHTGGKAVITSVPSCPLPLTPPSAAPLGRPHRRRCSPGRQTQLRGGDGGNRHLAAPPPRPDAVRGDLSHHQRGRGWGGDVARTLQMNQARQRAYSP